MNDDTILALVIRPFETPGLRRIPNTLKAKQRIVGGLIESVPIGDGVSCYVNEEGKLNGLAPNRGLRWQQDGPYGRKGELADIICGTFVITGFDPETGEDASLTPAQADEYERRFHSPEAMYRTPSGRIGMTPVHVGR